MSVSYDSPTVKSVFFLTRTFLEPFICIAITHLHNQKPSITSAAVAVMGEYIEINEEQEFQTWFNEH